MVTMLRPVARQREWARPKRAESQARLAFWLLVPAAVAVFGVIVYPLLRTILISLFQVQSSLATDTPFVGVRNYTQLLGSGEFWSAVGRTLYFTLVSTGLELVFGLLIAGLLNAPLRARWLFRTIVVIPWAMPTIVTAAMWKGILNAQYGALNALLTQLHLMHGYQVWLGSPTTALNMVIMTDVWKNTSIVAFFLLAGLTSIPGEVYEGAKVDGAGPIRTLRHIILPMLAPSIAVILVLRTVEAFKVFDIIYAMTRDGPVNGTQTVAYYAYTQAFSNQNLGLGAALSDLVVVAILMLTTIYLRLLRRSQMSVL
jgi:ABC-type sugar transport system permease subunit